MGCGKTSIGRNVAKTLKLNFFDLDKEVENYLKLSVVDIFEKYGETYFRKKEKEVLSKLLFKKNVLLALGGGAFCNKSSNELIKNNSLSVWINVNQATLFKRINKNKNKRPLLSHLSNEKLKEQIKILSKTRNKWYRLADLHIKLSDQPLLDSVSITTLKIQSYINSYETE